MKRNIKAIGVSLLTALSLSAAAVAPGGAVAIPGGGRDSVAPAPRTVCAGNTCVTTSIAKDGDTIKVSVMKRKDGSVVTVRVVVDKQTGRVTTVRTVKVRGTIVSKSTSVKQRPRSRR